MEQAPLHNQIVSSFDDMSPQLQAAARYILDQPRDVALLSMREQAHRAGVQPATMTRLAQYLGLEGYDAVRVMYADAMRSDNGIFSNKAGAQLASQKLKGEKSLAVDMVTSIGKQIANLAEQHTLDQLVAAAKLLASARRIYCLGLRSSYPVAWHFHYILSFLGDPVIMLDGVGGIGTDAIRGATSDDALLVVSVLPYTRATVETAQYMASLGVAIVAVTDSEVAPLVSLAHHVVLVSIDSPSFLHTMAPAFLVAEILGALIVGRGGEKALEAVRATDKQLADFNVHLKQTRRTGQQIRLVGGRSSSGGKKRR